MEQPAEPLHEKVAKGNGKDRHGSRRERPVLAAVHRALHTVPRPRARRKREEDNRVGGRTGGVPWACALGPSESTRPANGPSWHSLAVPAALPEPRTLPLAPPLAFPFCSWVGPMLLLGMGTTLCLWGRVVMACRVASVATPHYFSSFFFFRPFSFSSSIL